VLTAISATALIKTQDATMRTIGWMGIIMLIAFTIEGFSVDSFALPYYWFTLGLVAATWKIETINRSIQIRG
jgi:hypothetical protein